MRILLPNRVEWLMAGLGAVLLMAAPARAEEVWKIEEGSSLKFTIVKDGDRPVNGAFENVQGELRVYGNTFTGEALVAPVSFRTGIKPRDLRVREVFFANTALVRYTITAIEGLTWPVKNKATAKIRGDLSLAGVIKPVVIPVRVTMQDGKLAVESTEPIVLSLKAYGLEDEKEVLITVCGHRSIADDVKLELSLTLGQ